MQNTNKKNLILLLSIAFIGSFLLQQNSSSVFAADDDSSQCNLLEGSNKDKCEELEKKEKAYAQIIELKKKQQTSLNNQIGLMEAEIGQLETKIDQNKNKLGSLSSQIENFQKNIAEKNDLMKIKKRLLGDLMRVYYEYSRQDTADFLAYDSERKMTDQLAEGDRLSQLGGKLKETLMDIQSIRDSLEKEKQAVEKKRAEITDLQANLEERNSTLEASKNQKNVLMVQTKGEELKYKKLLERVEAQKEDLLGDIDELFNSNSAELNALSASLEKPSSKYWASNNWYYSQKDGRWGNSRIGNSKSLMKDFGCAISSVAMVFTFHGEKITPGSMAKQSIYSWDLINWPTSWNGIELTTNSKHGGINWSMVDNEIKKGNPVIIFIKAKGRAGHYVVVHNKDDKGRYVVHDPYFGSNIFLNSTIKLLAKMYGSNISSISAVDQMVIYKK